MEIKLTVKYALESPSHGGCYYTGLVIENGAPEVCNNIDRAVLYDTLPDANHARNSLRCFVNFQVREIIFTRKAGQIVD